MGWIARIMPAATVNLVVTVLPDWGVVATLRLSLGSNRKTVTVRANRA